MNEIRGNIFKYIGKADAVCVTTNGVLKKGEDGCPSLVMGKGIALAFAKRYPRLPSILGGHVNRFGNRAFRVREENIDIVSFPTKHNWRDNSDISLIKKSAKEIVEMADKFNWNRIILPRPGCSNGQLDWKDVKKEIEGILDDRFYVITKF